MKCFNRPTELVSLKLFKSCIYILIASVLSVSGLVINPELAHAALAIDPAGPITDNLTECVPYTRTFNHSGTSCPGSTIFFYWLAGPPPPPWLSLDMNTGELIACPPWGSAAGGPYGPYFVGVTELRVAPFCWSASLPPCSITLNVAAAENITIIPTYVLMWAMENMPLTLPLSATGCSGNYTWSATGLPLGVSVDPVSGVISGIPPIGTAGIYNVTVTATDTNTCCCPPGSRDFILVIDSWALYIQGIILSETYDFTVQIGPGLTQGQTGVTIDGSPYTMLGGNQSESITAHPGEIHFVAVDKIVQGADPRTRFAVKGANQTVVDKSNTTAYFDYIEEVYISTASDPAGIAQPPGGGYYAVGGTFSSTAPSPVAGAGQEGVKYIFKSWSLPGGDTSNNRDVTFTVSSAGTATAVYDTYYLLQLKSDYPPVNDASWHLKDSTASWDLALQDVPMTGFWGFLGGTIRPENPRGTHVMTAPYTQIINWYYDFTVPIVILSLIALLIIGLVIFLVVWSNRKKGKSDVAKAAMTAPDSTPQPPATAGAGTAAAFAAAPEKKALPEAEEKEKPNFCPKCGAPVDADAEFCKKCGRKLM